MSHHTPGPWHTNELSIVADYTTPDGNRHSCHVADITNRNDINRGPSIEEHANARLIAAAPELLNALLSALEAHDDDKSWEDAALAVVTKARP